MPSGGAVSKMATKNCPKCDSANPVACKKCACGHVFFTTRRSANALAVDYGEEISEPTTPQEPEVPRRRTARVTRERPQFYDALQVENQTRRQRELQKRRKASKSDDVDVSSEDIPEKTVAVATTKKRAESPPAKSVEPPTKKRRGRPPGLTNRRSARAQILATNKSSDATIKPPEYADNSAEDHAEVAGNIHDVPPVKVLQMNLVLSDINSRIFSSSVRAEENLPSATTVERGDESKDVEMTTETTPTKVEPAETKKVVAAKSSISPTKKKETLVEIKKEDGEKITSPIKKKEDGEKITSPIKKKEALVEIKKDEDVKSVSPVRKIEDATERVEVGMEGKEPKDEIADTKAEDPGTDNVSSEIKKEVSVEITADVEMDAKSIVKEETSANAAPCKKVEEGEKAAAVVKEDDSVLPEVKVDGTNCENTNPEAKEEGASKCESSDGKSDNECIKSAPSDVKAEEGEGINS